MALKTLGCGSHTSPPIFVFKASTRIIFTDCALMKICTRQIPHRAQSWPPLPVTTLCQFPKQAPAPTPRTCDETLRSKGNVALWKIIAPLATEERDILPHVCLVLHVHCYCATLQILALAGQKSDIPCHSTFSALSHTEHIFLCHAAVHT